MKLMKRLKKTPVTRRQFLLGFSALAGLFMGNSIFKLAKPSKPLFSTKDKHLREADFYTKHDLAG